MLCAATQLDIVGASLVRHTNLFGMFWELDRLLGYTVGLESDPTNMLHMASVLQKVRFRETLNLYIHCSNHA